MQSAVPLQPHCPLARQTLPVVPAVQSAHWPAAPQEVASVPGWQVPLEAAEQQPVTQAGVGTPQVKLQRWVVPSQPVAVPGQSPMTLQPHWPPPVTAVQM